jgi:transcriptional regulator of acetoin/glycerol metabolism/AraC-like DNA-binding protein
MASSVRSASSSDTPAQHAEDVYLVAQGNTPPNGIEQVSASWRRSATEHGVDPLSSEAPRILLPHELKDFREPLDELIFSAQEEIDRLYRVVREAGYTVLLCDTAGVAVEHRGDNADASRFRYWGTWLGGMWSEAMEGTNGIGTCIAEERPITVHRGQHFRSRHINLSCSTAPIFDVDGRLMAVLDVSAVDPQLSEGAHALTGALTATAARAISGRWFRERFRREWILSVSPIEDGEPGMLLAIDGNQRIVGANRAARTALLLDDQRLRTGLSLWSFFERDLGLFRRKEATDVARQLTIAGSNEAWPALVTPPESTLGAQRSRPSAALHTRPRLNALASLKQRTPVPQARGGLPPGAMRRVREYVDAHLGESMDLAELASIAGLSVFHFARQFKQSAGITPHHYLVQRRIERAQDMLARTDLALSEIALAAGFSDQSHLARHFRQMLGTTPREFRWSQR